MEQTPNNPEVAESTKMVKVSKKNFDRLKQFGCAGESLNTALGRVLDLAEDKEKKQ
jgi:hypothetical protein